MEGIYLVNYSMKGIKSLDEEVSLSFYKKTLTSNPHDFQNYNIKGIYGINGSGKSAIITSVKIFKNLIINKDYLNNPLIQSQLRELINKKLMRTDFSADYFARLEKKSYLFHYEISVSNREKSGRIVIDREKLSYRTASSRQENMKLLFEVNNGKIEFSDQIKQDFCEYISDKTKNLLKTATVSSFLIDYLLDWKDKKVDGSIFGGLLMLFLFGLSMYVYMDQTDDHADYFIDEIMAGLDQETDSKALNSIQKAIHDVKKLRVNEISISRGNIPKKNYAKYQERVSRLFDFISIFKRDLKGIEIDKKENKNYYICDLIMDYNEYKINVEFESTGIKKLIKLYEFFDEMASGNIVFVDELDSNLHDVYLCALLEYLMEHGKGQLCFTTHNIGPMDVLKRNKKSIDFLSVNHKIYPWTKNGNYSPANLYKSGMIEGSPFNIDSIDFISAFDAEEGDGE